MEEQQLIERFNSITSESLEKQIRYLSHRVSFLDHQLDVLVQNSNTNFSSAYLRSLKTIEHEIAEAHNNDQLVIRLTEELDQLKTQNKTLEEELSATKTRSEDYKKVAIQFRSKYMRELKNNENSEIAGSIQERGGIMLEDDSKQSNTDHATLKALMEENQNLKAQITAIEDENKLIEMSNQNEIIMLRRELEDQSRAFDEERSQFEKSLDVILQKVSEQNQNGDLAAIMSYISATITRSGTNTMTLSGSVSRNNSYDVINLSEVDLPGRRSNNFQHSTMSPLATFEEYVDETPCEFDSEPNEHKHNIASSSISPAPSPEHGYEPKTQRNTEIREKKNPKQPPESPIMHSDDTGDQPSVISYGSRA